MFNKYVAQITNSDNHERCTKAQQAKRKVFYQECEDLMAKLEQNPQVLRNFKIPGNEDLF